MSKLEVGFWCLVGAISFIVGMVTMSVIGPADPLTSIDVSELVTPEEADAGDPLIFRVKTALKYIVVEETLVNLASDKPAVWSATHVVIADGESYIVPAAYRSHWHDASSTTLPWKEEGSQVQLPKHWQLWNMSEAQPDFAPGSYGMFKAHIFSDNCVSRRYGHYYISEE